MATRTSPIKPGQRDTVKLLKGHNTQHSGHVGHFSQNEIMPEIYSKSLVRAIGKAYYHTLNLARTLIRTHKGDEKWPLFVNKLLFWWSASITLDKTKMFLQTFSDFSHFILYHIPQLA